MTDSLGSRSCGAIARKSEKQTALMTSVNRKSEKVEKHNRQSPLRRSERGKKDVSSGSSDSRNVGEGSNSFEANRKKIQQETSLNVEEAKDVICSKNDKESSGPKRKRMDARSYRALFRTQKIKETLTDDLRRMDAPSDTDCAASQLSSSRLTKPGEEEGYKCVRELANETEDGCLEILEDGAGKIVSSSRTSVSNISTDVCKAELLNSRSRGSVTEKSCEPSVPSDVDGETAPDNTCFGAEVSQELEMVDSDSIGASIGFNALEKSHQSMNSKIPDPSCDVGGVSPSVSQCPSPSAGERYHCFVGTCEKCFKESRLKHDSPEQELCSCNIRSVKHIDGTSCVNGMDPEANTMLRSAEKLWSCDKIVGAPGDPRHDKVCYVCLKDGNLVLCHGMGCGNGCHISCLDLPLADVLSVAWHCIGCVKKKIGSGVHSVSKGVEETFDSREVMISDTKGKYVQKQYLVKYHGLAHVHNHWVPETMLQSHQVDKLIQKQQQGLRWNSDWTVPHRLLKKRSLKFPEQQTSSRADSTTFFCQYEWLVKWRNLGYEHASWELEDAYFLQSSLAQKLVREYELRIEKMERVVHKSCEGSSVQMKNLPLGGSTVADCIILNVNKLQEFWYKDQNAVVFDDQDRVVSSILFVMALADTGHPFLVIANSDATSHWETEFMRVAPSVDFVVYDGIEETRRSIRALEFYGKGNRVIPQVLLASSEATLEDVHFLKDIRWGAIIIDQLDTGVSSHLEQMRMLTTNSRVILFVSQRKDRVTDYLGLLSLLECHDSSKGGDGKCENNINKFKEQLSRYIAYGCIAEPSKFVEYWVPAQISNLQLEQYCATLLSNSMYLCSCSKKDLVGALREILSTIRKCCDHPYLVDPTLQRSIIKGLPLSEILDVGIKASGKLQILDMILSEIKARQLRVLIVFQPIVGSAISIGDILDDFVRQRFGQDSYERVDTHVSKKQASLNRFNKKESGQFVFLLEKGACVPSIKLASVDTIIIFDSDWNPGNDLRALQRISISSQFSQIKVFRLYSAFTIEEKALILAKQGIYLDNNLQNISRSNSDTLLSWGASNLFNRIEEFHSRKSRTMLADIPFEDLHANDVLREFQVTLTAEPESMDPKKYLIPKAKQLKGVYCTNFPLLGEIKIQSLLGEEPHIFWKNLLKGRDPCWRYPCLMTRNRKRVQYFDGSIKKPEMESDDLIKKRRKVVDNGLNASPGEEPAAAHGTGHANQSLQLPDIGGGASSPSPASSLNSQDNISLPKRMQDQSGEKLISNEQTSIHIYLSAEMEKMCELLSLKEDMKHVLHAFMGYVVENHRVSKENVTIFQALQISLCWVAASMLKKKIDRGYSLMLAKTKLKFECSVEEVDYVYKKLRMLKKTFLQQPSIAKEWQALINPTSTQEHVCKDPLDAKTLESVHLRSESQETANEENLTDVEHAPEDRSCNHESETMSMLREKQQEEIDEFHKVWEEKRLLMEKKNSVEAGVIRLIHHNFVVRMEKLKLLDIEFSRKLEEHKKLMEAGLTDLKEKHLAALNEEREEKAQWLAKCCGRENRTSGAAVSNSTVVAVQCTTPTDSDHLQDKVVNDLQTSNGFPSGGVLVCSMVDAVAIDIPFGTTVTLNETDNNLHSNDNTLLDISVDAVNEGERCAVRMEIGSVQGAPTSGRIKLTVPERTSIPRDEEDNDVASNVKCPMSGRETHSKQSPNCNVVDHSYVCEDIDSAKTVTNAESHVGPFPEEANESVPADMPEEAHEVLPSIDDPDMNTTDIQSNEVDAGQDRVGCSGSHDILATEMDDASGTDRSSDQASLIGHPDEEIDPADHTFSAPRQATTDELPQRSMATAVRGEDDQDHGYLPNVVESTESENMPQLTTHNLTGDAGSFSGAADNGLTAEPLGPESCSSACQNFSNGCTSLQALETTHQVEEPPNHSQQHQPQDIENSGLSSSSVIENPNIVINSHSLPPVNNGLPASRFFESLQSVAQPSVVEDSSQRINRAVQQAANQLGLPDSHSSLQADPLQIELENLRKQLEQTTKGHENLRSQLRANCEKEIAEVVAEIRKKYEAKLQDAEAIFQLKKKSLDTNVNKVFLNKILADAVSTKCIDVRPSVRPAGVWRQQGVMQQLQQISLQPMLGPSAGSSSPGVAPASQQNTSLTLPAETHSAALSVGVSSGRPPIISSISCPQTNARVGGDVRAAAPHLQSVRADVRAAAPHLQPVGTENRSAAPHLQPFRPPVSVTGPPHSSLSHSVTTQQFPANQTSLTIPSRVLPVQQIQPLEPSTRIPHMSSQALLPHSQTAGSPISPSESQRAGRASYHRTHPSALELLRDIDRRFNYVLPNTSVSPVVTNSNVHRVEGGSASSVVPTDVVCLSDDE